MAHGYCWASSISCCSASTSGVTALPGPTAAKDVQRWINCTVRGNARDRSWGLLHTPPQADGETRPRTPAQTATSQSDTARQSIGKRVAAYARKMVGVPNKYGGKSPSGFDCSDLVHYSYGRAGITVPSTSRAQLGASQRITLHQARPGDLWFSKAATFHT